VISGGYSKAARNIAALASEDRHWVLSQLGEDDRTRILLILKELSSPADSVNVGSTAELSAGADGSGSSPASSLHPMERDDHAIVAAVDLDALIPLLASEPDWLVAVLLTQFEWSWAERFMESCSVERLQRIAEAMKAEAVVVKPRVRQVVLSNIAQKLRHRPQTLQSASPFERILSRAEKRVSQASSADGATA
jgi:hypothetical protein